LPTCEEDIEDFVRDLASSYKKTSYLKEALTHSWARENIDFRCVGGRGNTLLHVATRMGETKLATAIAHMSEDVNQTNSDGDTPLHLAARHDRPAIVETLLKHGASLEKTNGFGLTPVQVAALQCHKVTLETLIKYGAEYRLSTPQKETLLHLACRSAWTRMQNLKEELNSRINVATDIEENAMSSNCHDIELAMHDKRRELADSCFPCFHALLEHFKRHPDIIESEDEIPTSPGTILHYFVCLNYADGVRALLDEPFAADADARNKNGISPLWVAAWYNHTLIGGLLLRAGADPNAADPAASVTPLHCAIYGYHIERVEETVEFVDALLKEGADPKRSDASGEAPIHLVVGTLDFRVMALFIDYLGPESLALQVINYTTITG